MTSEPNTNIGSTSTNQSTYNLQNDEIKSKKKIKDDVRLILFMDKNQADNLGISDLFDRYDINKTGVIETEEYINYKTGADPTTTYKKPTKEESDNYWNTLTPKAFTEVISKSFKDMGIDDEISKAIVEMQNGEKKDVNTLAKEHFNIDLTQFKTEEEKQAAFTKALKAKYDIPATNNLAATTEELLKNGELDNPIKEDDSIYVKHLKRIRSGEFNDDEKEIKGVDSKSLNSKQLAAYARKATVKEEIVQLSKYFAQSDEKSQKYLVNNIENLDAVVQTGMIGAAVLSAKNRSTSEMYAKLLNDQDLHLTSEFSDRAYQMAVKTMQYHLDSEESFAFMLKEGRLNKTDQLAAFKMYDGTEREKVADGIITQEEYDNNYVNIYAANAYKIELASEAYKEVINNANDTNRAGAMNMLASNAYQIKDDAQRNGAISNIKNSGYYNDEVRNNLDQSYAKNIEQKYNTTNNTNSNTTRVQPSSYQTQPNTNPLNSNNYEQITNSIIESDNDLAIQDLTTKTISDINKPGQTKTEHKLGIQKGMRILTTLISNNKLQNSPYEGIVLNKLSALPAPTLLNMFLGANEKVQTYFYKNNLLNPLTIAMNATHTEISQLPENIQKPVMIIRNENYLNKPEMA